MAIPERVLTEEEERDACDGCLPKKPILIKPDENEMSSDPREKRIVPKSKPVAVSEDDHS